MTEEQTIKCPHCFEQIDARATVCPHCGKNTREKTAAYQIGSFLMALGLLGAVGAFFVDPTLMLVAAFVLLLGLVIRRQA